MNKGRILGVIPARGGSRGIPKKNIVRLAGKPMLGWVAEAAQRCSLIDELIVSSDSDEIIEVARSFGVDAPFKRPAELARDDTLVVDVLAHALGWMAQNRDQEFEYVCLLQPTAPFAQTEDYEKAIRKAYEEGADTVISVNRCGQLHPSIMYKLHEDGRAEWLFDPPPGGRMLRRQDLPPIYIRTGTVYVIKAQLILDERTMYGDRLYAIEVPEERTLGIDTPLDLKLAEVLMRELLDRERRGDQ